MYSRPAAAAFLLLASILAAAPGRALAQVSARPNVLFIAVDDLNDWIGVMGGYPGVKTPNIDRLAARGVLFRRAYSAAPACNPSRVALMTGVRPSTSGIYHNDQPWRPVLPEAVTLSQLFMRNGYEVVGRGKIFHGRYEEDASWERYSRPEVDPKPRPAVANDPRTRAGGIIWGALDAADEEMSDYRIASFASEFLSRRHERPFFLGVGIYKPHMPWQVPQKYYDMYPLEGIALPKVLKNDLADVPPAGIKIARPGGDHAEILRTGNWTRAVQGYLASITFADAQIGRILDALDRSPHRDNTAIVLWGDHGWHLGEKQHWRKFALWEEATRAPLIFVVPGVTRPGGVSARPVDFVNIYPTLADLAGLAVPGAVEGESLRPLLVNPMAAWSRPALMTHGRENHAVRTERWRYIRYADGSEELYDHAADPFEWRNLAADPAHAATKAELVRSLPKVNAPDAPRDAGTRG